MIELSGVIKLGKRKRKQEEEKKCLHGQEMTEQHTIDYFILKSVRIFNKNYLSKKM